MAEARVTPDAARRTPDRRYRYLPSADPAWLGLSGFDGSMSLVRGPGPLHGGELPNWLAERAAAFKAASSEGVMADGNLSASGTLIVDRKRANPNPASVQANANPELTRASKP